MPAAFEANASEAASATNRASAEYIQRQAQATGSYNLTGGQPEGVSSTLGPGQPSGNPYAPNSSWQSVPAGQGWYASSSEGSRPSLYPPVFPAPTERRSTASLDNSDPWDRATLAAASTAGRPYPSLTSELGQAYPSSTPLSRQATPQQQHHFLSASGPSYSAAEQQWPLSAEPPWQLSPWQDSQPAQQLSDEDMARKLQEELNLESPAALRGPARPSPGSARRQPELSPALRDYLKPVDGDDERLARQLQEECDREEAVWQQAASEEPLGREKWRIHDNSKDDEALARALQQEEIAAQQKPQPPDWHPRPVSSQGVNAPLAPFPTYGPRSQAAAYRPNPLAGRSEQPQALQRQPSRGALLMGAHAAQAVSTEDEALARALQEEYNREAAQGATAVASGSGPQHNSPGPPVQAPTIPSPAQRPDNGRKWGLTSFLSSRLDQNCKGCGQPITVWSGQHMTALGSRWHVGCLRCGGCGQLITEQVLTQSSDGKPYHVRCFREAFHPRCSVCAELCPQQEDGRITVMKNDFWPESFCPKHNSDGTVRCCACSRLQPLKERWVSVECNRLLCLACVSSIVVDTQDAQPLYDDVLRFYERMGMRLPEKPPMLLVDSATLGDAEVKEGRAQQPHSGTEQVFHTRGLCLSQEYRQIETVVRHRRNSFFNLSPEVVHIPGPSHCEVTAILVLHGLPYLMTGSIIAHELMHAWLRLTGTAHGRLSLDVEEGLCQLMAVLWLEGQPAPLDGTWEERLHSYCVHKIRSDPSMVYGDGFRAALDSFQTFGLPTVLRHVRETGQFPPHKGA